MCYLTICWCCSIMFSVTGWFHLKALRKTWIYFFSSKLLKMRSSICFILFFFKSKVSYLTSQVKIPLNLYTYFFSSSSVNIYFSPFLSLGGFFHYFGHHGRPHLKFSTRFSSLIILNQRSFWSKKTCALGVLRYGFGPKQPRLVYLGTIIFA